MRTTFAGRCVRRTTSRPDSTATCVGFRPTQVRDDTAAWARAVIADPARYRATRHEANLVADLLAQLGGDS